MITLNDLQLRAMRRAATDEAAKYVKMLNLHKDDHTQFVVVHANAQLMLSFAEIFSAAINPEEGR